MGIEHAGTGPVNCGLAAQHSIWRERRVTEHFGPLLEEPLEIDTLALFVEPEPGAPFVVRSLHMLGAMAQLENA